MKISIIGSGNIGGTLGRKWAGAGHVVRFGVRHPADPKYQSLLDNLTGDAEIVSIEDAAAFGEVALLAVPGGAVEQVMAGCGDVLDGKIILDATNNVGQAELNSFATISAQAPAVKLYRAFSTLGWENFETPTIAGEQVDLFYCGDEGPAQRVVEGLITDVGLRPVFVGGREQVGVVDGLTRLWFAMAFGQGRGRRLAFKMLEA